MPPSPGKIHSLPIKLLYTIDTSPQSYLAVLPERHDVYVHPKSPASGSKEQLGSTTLKALARGICFASPECVPNKTSLDFTVYNLDPSVRTAGPNTEGPSIASRAFPTPEVSPSAISAWMGKGFLSWALAEDGPGNTLARGRLVREYEFSSACFSDGGGLEALMAASRGGTSAGEDADGKGWGLEVTLTLRQVNPEGKSEFSHRRAFENMLAGGKSSASEPIAVASSPKRQPPSSPARVVPSSPARGFAKPAIPPPKAPSPRRNGTNQASGSKPETRPLPARMPSNATGSSSRSRETTPPPRSEAPVQRTPPPPSPSRAKLMSLLKSEGKMSPDTAKKLMGNTFLVRLLKSLPVGSTDPEAPNSPSKPGSSRLASAPAFPLPQNLAPHPASAPAGPASADSPWAPTPTNPVDACFNCGATESEGWMAKRLRDGSAARVCNDCGLYFNKHKTMRPREVWSAAGVAKSDPPVAVRSSPRLNRKAEPPIDESPRKRARKTAVPMPSPRKAAAAPMPSPRRATRLAAKEEAEKAAAGDATTPTPGGDGVSSLDFSSHFPFDSGGNPFHTGSTPVANNQADGEVDLATLFLQFASAAEAATPGSVGGGPPADADGLEALFGDDNGESFMEMLRSIESEAGSEA